MGSFTAKSASRRDAPHPDPPLSRFASAHREGRGKCRAEHPPFPLPGREGATCPSPSRGEGARSTARRNPRRRHGQRGGGRTALVPPPAPGCYGLGRVRAWVARHRQGVGRTVLAGGLSPRAKSAPVREGLREGCASCCAWAARVFARSRRSCRNPYSSCRCTRHAGVPSSSRDPGSPAAIWTTAAGHVGRTNRYGCSCQAKSASGIAQPPPSEAWFARHSRRSALNGRPQLGPLLVDRGDHRAHRHAEIDEHGFGELQA